MALTKIDDRGLKTPIDLLDNEKIRFGTTDNDLEIFHDSNNSYIKDTGTGALVLATSKLSVNNAASNEELIVAYQGGSVELFHSNTKKFETTSDGVKISDSVLEIADTSCHIDLMETSSTNHRIRNGNGNFYVQKLSDDKNTSTTQLLIDGGTGATELYYDGSKKFETTANGIKVPDSARLSCGDGEDLIIKHDGTDASLHNGTGNLKVIAANNVEAIRVHTDATVDIGYQTDNVQLRLGAGSDLKLYHDSGGDSYIQEKGPGVLYITATQTILQNNDTSENLAKFVENGAVELYHDGAKIFETTTSGVTVTSGGNTPQIDYIGASNNYLGRIDCDAITGTTSNMRFYVETGGSIAEKLRLQTGGGISFNGDTAAANALDDYEEGTWSPTLPNGSTSALQIHSAFYTKIGRQVMCYMYVYSINISGSTNEFRFAGLPFTVKSGQHYGGGSIGYVGTLDYQKPLLPLVSTGNSHLYFHRQDGSSAPWTYQDQVNVGGGTNGFLILNVHYLTDA